MRAIFLPPDMTKCQFRPLDPLLMWLFLFQCRHFLSYWLSWCVFHCLCWDVFHCHCWNVFRYLWPFYLFSVWSSSKFHFWSLWCQCSDFRQVESNKNETNWKIRHFSSHKLFRLFYHRESWHRFSLSAFKKSNYRKRIKSIEINSIFTSLLSISMIDVRCVPKILNFTKNINCDKNSCCFVEVRRPNKHALKFYLIV